MSDSPPQVEAPKALPFWRELLGILPWGFLYLLTLTENFSATHDSIAYLNELELDPEISWYSHHLLWHPFMKAWISLWPASVAVYIRIELLHAICGMILLMLFYTFVRKRFDLPMRTAYAATALPALSYGIWCYSTVVEVYIMPLCALMGCLLLLTQTRQHLSSGLLASALLAIAILFHQSHILFIPAFLFGIYWNRDQHRMSGTSLIGLHLLVLAIFVGLPYLGVMTTVLEMQSLADMWNWLVGYGHTSTYWAEPGMGMLTQAGVGAGRSFIGGQFAFGLESIASGTARTGFGLSDEAFLVRTLKQDWILILIGISVGFVLWMFSNLIRLPYRWKAASARHQQLAKLLSLALLSYSLFFLFWVPVNPEFWLPQMLFLCLLIGRFRLMSHRAWLAIPAYALGAINYWGSMAHLQFGENDLYEVEAREMATFAGENDRIILTDSWIRAEYLRRYSGASITVVPIWLAEGGSYESLIAGIESDLQVYRQIILQVDFSDTTSDPAWWAPLEDRLEVINLETGPFYLLR
ncbi:MAG: glycosyltransferase family 39 protein [Bacteroidota bacterium]